MILDELIEASKDGIRSTLAQHGVLLAVPRIVLYTADQPEERHVLSLQGTRCGFPCSPCMPPTDGTGCARSQSADCDVLEMLTIQLEGRALEDMGEGIPDLPSLELLPVHSPSYRFLVLSMALERGI